MTELPAAEGDEDSGAPAPPPEYLGWPTWPLAEQDTVADPWAAQQVFQAQVGARGKRIEDDIARAVENRQAVIDARTADLDQNLEFQKAMLEVAKGGVDRSRANAETVQKAAGAIGTIYTGILGVAFSVSSRPLPTRGVLPALFLGVAVAASTAYLAYVSSGEDTEQVGLDTEASGVEGQMSRLVFLLTWIRASVRKRAWMLRSSVVALALGVVLLPVSFIGAVDHATGVPTSPAWPSPDTALTGDLQKIKYQAQVDEVAALRTSQASGADDTSLTVILALTGLALVVVGGVLPSAGSAAVKAVGKVVDVPLALNPKI